MPRDDWKPGQRKDVARQAREVERNGNHPNRFVVHSGGALKGEELEQKRLKEMMGRFTPGAGPVQDEVVLTADFTAGPLLDKLIRPVFPEMADAINERKPFNGVEYPSKRGKESQITLTSGQFLKLAAEHGYNPSQKIEIKGALADEWKALGGGSGMIKS